MSVATFFEYATYAATVVLIAVFLWMVSAPVENPQPMNQEVHDVRP